MENLKQKTYKAFAWNFSSRIINLLLSFIISIFLARILEPSDFGTFAIVGVIINFSHIFMDMGLGVSLIEKNFLSKYHYGSVFWFNVVVSILLSFLLYSSSVFVAKFYDNSELIQYIKVLSLLFIINSFSPVISARLQKDLNMKLPMLASLVSSAIGGSIGIGMAINGYGIWSLVIQSLITAIINNLIIIVFNPYPYFFYFKWKALMELWNFGFRMFFSGVIDSVFGNVDTLVIGKLFSLNTVGLYNRAKNLDNLIIKNISSSLMSVVMPALSSIKTDKQRYEKVINIAIQTVSFLSFGLSGILFLIGHNLIIIIYGYQWGYAGELFSLLMVSGFSYPISAVLVNILSSQGNSKAFLTLEIYKKIVYSLNFAFGFIWGIKGFVFGIVIVYIISVFLNIFMASKQMNLSIKWFNKRIWIYGLVSFISVIFTLIINYKINNIVLHFFISGSVFTILYIALSRLLKLEAIFILIKEIKLILN
jgi:O-antigen/teichoic acid export membrane protein